MVVKHVPIEPIIVKCFLVRLIFQVVFEIIDEPSILPEIIDKNSGPIAKIVLRPSKERSSNNFTFSNSRLVLNIKINGLSIPCDDGFGFKQFFNTIETFIAIGDYGGPWDDIRRVVLFVWVFVLFELFVDVFEAFNGSIFELSGVDFIKTILRGTCHSIRDSENFAFWKGGGLFGEHILNVQAV